MAPLISADLASSPVSAAAAAAISRAAISQVRGDGQPRPAAAALVGGAQASPGRTCRKAATRPRDKISSACHPSGSTGTTGADQPPASPSATARGSVCHARWQSRLASGADRSQPSAACSGGLAAATTATSSGSVRSPTARSSTTRSRAAWTAGGAVDSSSRNSSPRPASASRRAQAGGANRTSPPTTMGSPAKSEGSLIEAITVSQGSPMAPAIARIADVLPVPGAPHSSTGTRAATATPSASTAGFCALISPSVAHPGHRTGG